MPASRYAEHTVGSPGRSQEEIDHTLQRFGAGKRLWARDDEAGRVTVAFERKGRAYRISFTLPQLGSFKTYTRKGAYNTSSRSDSAAKTAQQQEHRRLFRSLANYVKATLAAVDDGLISAEEALMPYMILRSGRTVSEEVEANIASLLEGHPLLPMLEAPSKAV